MQNNSQPSLRTTTSHPPASPCGITEEMISQLVEKFYARVRLDPVLGPIFNEKIHDWDGHLAKIHDFWSSVILTSGRYKGRPVPAHLGIPGIDEHHFAQWLGLFESTARETCPADAAALFTHKARKIADSLQMAIAFQRGETRFLGNRT